MEQDTRPKNNPLHIGKMIFHKGAKSTNRERMAFSTNGAEKMGIHMPKN